MSVECFWYKTNQCSYNDPRKCDKKHPQTGETLDCKRLSECEAMDQQEYEEEMSRAAGETQIEDEEWKLLEEERQRQEDENSGGCQDWGTLSDGDEDNGNC